MATDAHKALPQYLNEKFIISFGLHLDPSSAEPLYVTADLSKGTFADGEWTWRTEGLTTFDAPEMMPPVAGRPLLPYFVYHLKAIEGWLVGEYAIDLVKDEVKPITTKVGASVLAEVPRPE